MSEEPSIWVGISEKLFGTILLIISLLMIYFTATSTDTLGAFTALFAFLSLIVLTTGVFLIIVKVPE